jgi:hypothetical protein
VEFGPYSGDFPGGQAIPERHAAAAHFLREILPGDAGFEHKEKAREANAIVHGRMPALGAAAELGKQGFDELPQVVRDQKLGHAMVLHDEEN